VNNQVLTGLFICLIQLYSWR